MNPFERIVLTVKGAASALMDSTRAAAPCASIVDALPPQRTERRDRYIDGAAVRHLDRKRRKEHSDEQEPAPQRFAINPERGIHLAHLLDVVQAARVRDEIEPKAGWLRCGLQQLEKPREPLRLYPQAYRLLGRPNFLVPHTGVVVLGPDSTPEAARFEACGRGQESECMNELLCAAGRSRQHNGEAYHAAARAAAVPFGAARRVGPMLLCCLELR